MEGAFTSVTGTKLHVLVEKLEHCLLEAIQSWQFSILNLLVKCRYRSVRVIFNKLRSVCVSAKTRYYSVYCAKVHCLIKPGKCVSKLQKFSMKRLLRGTYIKRTPFLKQTPTLPKLASLASEFIGKLLFGWGPKVRSTLKWSEMCSNSNSPQGPYKMMPRKDLKSDGDMH